MILINMCMYGRSRLVCPAIQNKRKKISINIGNMVLCFKWFLVSLCFNCYLYYQKSRFILLQTTAIMFCKLLPMFIFSKSTSLWKY